MGTGGGHEWEEPYHLCLYSSQICWAQFQLLSGDGLRTGQRLDPLAIPSLQNHVIADGC